MLRTLYQYRPFVT